MSLNKSNPISGYMLICKTLIMTCLVATYTLFLWKQMWKLSLNYLFWESPQTHSDRKPLRSCRFQQNVFLYSGGLIREDKFPRHSRFHPGIGPDKILHLCGISCEDEGRTVTCGVVPTFDGGHNCFHSLVAEVLFGVASETVGLIEQQRAACSLITISLVFTADPQITSATNSSLCMTVR